MSIEVAQVVAWQVKAVGLLREVESGLVAIERNPQPLLAARVCLAADPRRQTCSAPRVTEDWLAT